MTCPIAQLAESLENDESYASLQVAESALVEYVRKLSDSDTELADMNSDDLLALAAVAGVVTLARHISAAYS